jgi:hypothetical protein
MRLAIALVAVTVAATALTDAQARSKWVYTSSDGRLRYGADARGNRIMDFSHAGFKGGGVALPAISAARTVTVESGDSTARIQAAIDEVSKLPRQADGFRGAVMLARGTYQVDGQLKIAASGVVLRVRDPARPGRSSASAALRIGSSISAGRVRGPY